MNNHNHDQECKHTNLKYCCRCDVVYCMDCNREWFNKVYSFPYAQQQYEVRYKNYPLGTELHAHN